MVVETELLAAASDVMTRLGFRDYRIRLNHRRLLNAVLSLAGVAAEQHGAVIGAIDKVDKIGQGEVAEEIRGVVSSPQQVATITTFLFPLQANAESADGAAANERALREIGAFVAGSDEGRAAVQQLSEVVRLSELGGNPAVRVDPTLARGLSYYTGPVFEIVVPDLAGSLAGGGRYDNLIGMFCGEDIPACGISLGLERILVVMGERGMFPPTLATTAADVMVVQWFANRADLYLELASELRAAGLRVDVYPDAPDQDGKKVGDRQFKYAGTRGVPFVAVVGAAELANGTVTVKNMKTGEQSAVPRGDVAGRLAAMMTA
jgi:histidyl-tRNA synthetase